MSMPEPVLLYDQPRAPNPRRLNIFLAEKGIEIPRQVLDLMQGEHKRPEYLEKTGAAQVPALALANGTVLTETQAIGRYLEALHPEPNLMGRDPLEQAEITMWQRRIEFGLFLSVAMCFRHTNPHMGVLEEQCAEWGEISRGRLAAHLGMLDQRLATRDWLIADRLTVADITAFVAVDFLRVIKYPVPQELTQLIDWRDRMKARPSTALAQ